MKIIRESLIAGAKKAKGLTVIIDVFRAFTTGAYLLSNGAERIIPLGELDEVFELKKQNPNFILMGERKGLKVAGFDYGNSPFKIKNIDFSNKTVVLSTSAGTPGIINAINATEIVLGNFVCINATINYIKKQNPHIVTLVSMGAAGIEQEMKTNYVPNTLKIPLMGKNRILKALKNI